MQNSVRLSVRFKLYTLGRVQTTAINMCSLVMWHAVSIPLSLAVSESGSSYQRAGGTLSGWREMNILFTPLLTNEDCSPSALRNCSFNFSVLIACPACCTPASSHLFLTMPYDHHDLEGTHLSSKSAQVSITLNGLYSVRVKLKQCKQGQSSECSNHLHLTSQSFTVLDKIPMRCFVGWRASP